MSTHEHTRLNLCMTAKELEHYIQEQLYPELTKRAAKVDSLNEELSKQIAFTSRVQEAVCSAGNPKEDWSRMLAYIEGNRRSRWQKFLKFIRGGK